MRTIVRSLAALLLVIGTAACSAEPTTTTTFEPTSYGSDAYLDQLYESCADGDMADCDALYDESPVGSDYEYFGDTCGETEPVGTDCDGSEQGDSDDYEFEPDDYDYDYEFDYDPPSYEPPSYDYDYEPPSYEYDDYEHEPPVYEYDAPTYRTGATCADGWQSDATGRGACSHHGGVAEWHYG